MKSPFGKLNKELPPAPWFVNDFNGNAEVWVIKDNRGCCLISNEDEKHPCISWELAILLCKMRNLLGGKI